MQYLQVNCTAGQAENYLNPSFGLGLNDRLEYVRHVYFHCGETGFVEFDTSRAGFLDAED